VFPLLNAFARIPVCGLIAHYNDTEAHAPKWAGAMMRNILTKRLTFRGFIVSDFAAAEFAAVVGRKTRTGDLDMDERDVVMAAEQIDDLPAFMAELRSYKGTGARALEFAILTAARSGEVRGATWSEIDLAAATWTVPASRMKAGKEHRVPLSKQAISLLSAQPRIEGTDLVFSGKKDNKPLSDMTLNALMRRMGVDAVPHGFRSTFRDWAAERTNYPHQLADMALAHAIGNKVEEAYRRGDMLAKRAQMMSAWAAFCDRPVTTKGDVVPMRKMSA